MHTSRYRRVWTFIRKDRRLRYRVAWIDDDGRQREFGRPTRELAAQLRRQIEAELNSPAAEPAAVKWAAAVAQFGDHLAGRSASHRRAVFGALADFTAHAGIGQQRGKHAIHTIADVRTEHVAAYLAALLRGQIPDRAPSAANQRKDWATLHAFFEMFVARAQLAVNPVAAIPRPRLVAHIPDAPEPAEWLALLQALQRNEEWLKTPEADRRRFDTLDREGQAVPYAPLWLEDPQAWHLLILLAATTGLDQTPLLRIALTAKPADPRDVGLELCGAEAGGVGLLRLIRPKSRHAQLVGIPPEVAQRVEARLIELPEGQPYLFPWRTWPRRDWERLTTVAHYRRSFRAFRAVSGTREVESAALERGRQLLGHSSARVTRGHYVGPRQLAIAAALALPPLPPELPPQPAYGDPSTRAARLAHKPGRRRAST